MLLAEDHAATSRLMKMMLQKMGCVVTVADDGQQAVEAIQRALSREEAVKHPDPHLRSSSDNVEDDNKHSAPTEIAAIDVVLMDGHMPRMGRWSKYGVLTCAFALLLFFVF